MKKTLSNNEIYNLVQKLIVAFDDKNQKLPVFLYFCIEKNKEKLLHLAIEIENSRLYILKQYGVLNETTNVFNIPKEVQERVDSEISELLKITQEVELQPIFYSDLKKNNTLLTIEQIEAILFMVETKEEDLSV